MDWDISWAVQICSTSVYKYRNRTFKQHQHLALKHRLIPKIRGITNTVLYCVIYSNALYKINIICISKKNGRCSHMGTLQCVFINLTLILKLYEPFNLFRL